jgi:hypothetical protein
MSNPGAQTRTRYTLPIGDDIEVSIWYVITASLRTLHSPTVPQVLRTDSRGNLRKFLGTSQDSPLPNHNSTTQNLFMNQDCTRKFQGTSHNYRESTMTPVLESYLSPPLDSLELTRTLVSLPGQKSTMLHTSLSSQNFHSDSTESSLHTLYACLSECF